MPSSLIYLVSFTVKGDNHTYESCYGKTCCLEPFRMVVFRVLDTAHDSVCQVSLHFSASGKKNMFPFLLISWEE